MAYVEVRKDGKLVKRRVVNDDRAHKGCRIRVGSAGQVHLRIGESKAVGKYEIAMLEGTPPDDGHEDVRQLGTKSDSFPAMSETEQAGFTGPAQAGPLGKKSPVPIIEDYEVTGRLGQGGMGTVWRAVQLSTKREVALKFLGRHRFASKRSRARFEREVSLAAKLTHSNIACVYDSGLHRGVYYYAMELVDGVHLDKYVQQNHLSQREILVLIKGVCDAVGYAHEKGIIHRDLKPSNILVTQDGRPHVVDFGLAKASMDEDDDVTISVDGEITGTLAYMSPEQAAGRLDKIGEPTDVYSLGVILHQLLTDRLPHDVSGSRYEVVKRIVEDDVRSPRAYNDSVDNDLESLILAALTQEPEDRYPSAIVLLQDIENYLNGEPLLARSMSATYRIRKRVRKHAKPIAKALLLITTLAAIIAVSFYLVSSERKKRYEVEKLAGLRPERASPLEPQVPSEVQDSRGDVSEADGSSEQVAEQSVLAWIPKRAPAPAAIQVNGKPFFVICADGADTNDLSEYEQTGFNTVLLSDSNSIGFSEADKLGLHVISKLPFNTADREFSPSDWTGIQHRLVEDMDQRSLLSWTSAVPPWGGFPRVHKNLKRISEEAKRVSSKTPVFISISPPGTNGLRERIEDLNYSDGFVLAPDIIPERRRQSGMPTEVSTISFWIDQISNVMKSKPLWATLRRYDPVTKNPSSIRAQTKNNQLRSMAYLAVNHGATGILIPAYDEELNFRYEDKTLKSQLAKALKTLSPAILAGEVLDEVTITNDNGKIDFKAYAAPDNQRIYLVAVNTSDTEVQPTFFIPNMRGTVHILNELRDIPRPDGQFSDEFKPYQTHIYVIRMEQDLVQGSSEKTNIIEVVEPKTNLMGYAGTEIFEPPQRLAPSLFEFAEVNVQLLDAAGAPLSWGELHCFNHNLGLFYPDRIARVILENSKALIHLPRGEYTIIGTAHGMIVTLRTVIAGDCSLVLRPDAVINIDTEGPVKDGLLFVVPSALRFLLPGYLMGPRQIPISLAVSSDVPLDLTLWQPPPNQPGTVESFVLRQTDVEPGTEVCLDSHKSALSQVTYGISNSNGLACPSHNLIVVIPPGAPGPLTIPHNATQQWDELSLYVTPGRTLLHRLGLVDQRIYDFYPKIIDLEAETIHDLRVDGQFSPSVRCHPNTPKQLLVELPSAGDWGLKSVATRDGQACGKIEFFDELITNEQDLFPTLDCRLKHIPKPGTSYRVTLDLGFFGAFKLDGKFQQSEDNLVVTRKETEHFTVLWPDCIGDRFGDYAEHLEQAYQAISRVLELEVSTKIEWSPQLLGAGGTGGSHFTTNLNYLKDPQSREPTCEYWKGAMARELGHVFQRVSDGLVDFGGPSPTCKEAFATVMRDIALQEIMAGDAALMVSLAHRENFFMTLYRQADFLGELKRPDDPACFGEYWRYYFILSHLTDVYGPGIHGEVVRAWGNPYAAKNTHRLLEAQGLGSEEIVCATYSAVVGEDLGWLFRLAEFDVPDGQFDDKFEPYQTHIYDIRMKQDLQQGSSEKTNISQVLDLKGNLMGNTKRTYLDIVKASVYEESDNCVLSVTTVDDFPTPEQLGDGDTYTFVWFVDIDRDRATGQTKEGNDYNIHLWCSNERAWYTSWYKTSEVSAKDGITIDPNKIVINIEGNTAMLKFPSHYLPSDHFDWWINSGTRPPNFPSATRNPPTQRGIFKRSMLSR